jgi:fatty acid desaturase
MATMNTVDDVRVAKLEWPTILLIVTVYAVLATLIYYHEILPWWIVLIIGPYAAALHSSLQHEVLHGHPTRHRIINEALVFITPTFWLPYHRYRDTHLRHHNDMMLTCPVNDPESYYLLPDTWAAMPGIKRRLFMANQTLLGRMVLGPAVSIVRFWSADIREAVKGDGKGQWHWMLFGMSCSLSVAFIMWSGMPLWKYYVLVAYPGISLALVRSYCEHQAAEAVGERTIIVEASPFWSLLFLNNNLHIAHHTRPSMPWYGLPAFYRAERDALIIKNNGYMMKGYSAIFRKYLLHAKEPIPHPNVTWLMPKAD